MKTWEGDNWRFNKEEKTHYCLDYRLVYARYSSCFESSYLRGDSLTVSVIETISDILTVANNLGFNIIDSDWNKTATSDKFLISSKEQGATKTFAEIRCYKNGNIHFKFNQDFIKALNVEAGRLLKWIKSPKQAQEEFPDDCKISETEAIKYFENNAKIISSNLKQLLLN